MKRVLVVDCNDSFVYNLVQLLRESGLCRFDVVNVRKIPFDKLNGYSHILLSPGPGLPSDLPNLVTLLQTASESHSILGVCLGMQAIGEFFDCRLQQLPEPKHGHKSELHLTNKADRLFFGINQKIVVGRYHSWIIDKDSVPPDLAVTAFDEEGNIMAFRHRRYPVWDVQFHPESIITSHGKQMIENWIGVSGQVNK